MRKEILQSIVMLIFLIMGVAQGENAAKSDPIVNKARNAALAIQRYSWEQVGQ